MLVESLSLRPFNTRTVHTRWTKLGERVMGIEMASTRHMLSEGAFIIHSFAGLRLGRDVAYESQCEGLHLNRASSTIAPC